MASNQDDKAVAPDAAVPAGQSTTTTTNDNNSERNLPKEGEYIQWRTLPAGNPDQLNRWSHFLTREHEFPGAQVSNKAVTVAVIRS